MPRPELRFLSRAERQKEEALTCRYGRIGIAAVAAATAMRQQAQSQPISTSSQMGWLEEHLPQQE